MIHLHRGCSQANAALQHPHPSLPRPSAAVKGPIWGDAEAPKGFCKPCWYCGAIAIGIPSSHSLQIWLILVFSVLLTLSLKTRAHFRFWPILYPYQNQDLASGEFRAETLSITQEILYLYYESKLGRELMYLNTCRIVLQ